MCTMHMTLPKQYYKNHVFNVKRVYIEVHNSFIYGERSILTPVFNWIWLSAYSSIGLSLGKKIHENTPKKTIANKKIMVFEFKPSKSKKYLIISFISFGIIYKTDEGIVKVGLKSAFGVSTSSTTSVAVPWVCTIVIEYVHDVKFIHKKKQKSVRDKSMIPLFFNQQFLLKFFHMLLKSLKGIVQKRQDKWL